MVKVILGHISGIKFGVLKVVYELSITEVVYEMGCNVSSIWTGGNWIFYP